MRRELGCEAFGINWFELGPNVAGLEHDEAGSGQEEVIVVVRGDGVYRIDGEEVPVQRGDVRPLRPGDDATAGGRPERADAWSRSAPAAGATSRTGRSSAAMVVRFVLWNLADSLTHGRRAAASTCATRRWTRSSEVPGLLFKAWFSDEATSAGARSTSSSRARRPSRRCRRARAS